MLSARLARWARFIEASFPERQIYVRTARDVRGVVLSTAKQLTIVGGLCGIALWAIAATVGMMAATISAHASIQQAQRTKAAYAGLIARHDERLIATVDNLAQGRADRLRATLRLAGVNPEAVAKPGPGGEGGPLIDAQDPRAIAAMADVNRQVAGSILRAAKDVSALRALARASAALPLAKPTDTTPQSSGYGLRADPFTGKAAFHSGLDFPAPEMTPVYATAPGVVSFAGPRAGYGSTVEITHGDGFMTRFAHLAVIAVATGQKVASHQRIGAIGSTGRSTGPHLHYEVWKDGRAQDPERFLKAGDYVQQAG